MGYGIETKEIRDVDGKSGEVDATDEEADNWHDNVVDGGVHDGRESGADDDTDGELDDAAAVDKFFKFFENFVLFDFGVS